MSADHDRAFFEQMATCREPYRRLGDAIHAAIGPAFGEGRALDLGAGLGYVPGRLRELGWDAYASDLYAPEDMREPPAGMWRWPAPLDAPWLACAKPFDVVVCTETAEHIDASAADTIAANVAGRARHLVVWSAAQPGQEWPGHVNLQPPAYWLEKFSRHGLDDWSEATARLRTEMLERHAQHEYAARNFFILSRVT